MNGIDPMIGENCVIIAMATADSTSPADLGGNLSAAYLPWALGAIGKAIGNDALIAMLDATVNKQAAMIAYLDVFTLMFWITIAMMPLLLLLRRPKAVAPAVHLAD